MAYSVASGQPVNAGRYSWMPTRLYEWVAIPNTAGAGGAAIDAYSGLAFKPSTAEIISAAAGGHNDSYDNRVVSISLLADAPSWVRRIAPSATTSDTTNGNGRRYYPDGKPASRHVYAYTQYVPSTDRVVMCGARYMGSAVYDSAQVDAVNCSNWTWDAEGANADVPAGGGQGVAIDGAGRIYTGGGGVWNDSAKTWGAHAMTFGRFSGAFDSSRNRFFSLQWGDGQGFSSGITALSSDISANTTTPITLAGPGLAQFTADAPAYAAMDYDSINDVFVFYCGAAGTEGRLYLIKPNTGTTWLITVRSLGSGSSTPMAVGSNGLQKRFFFSAALCGFVTLPQAASNLYFLRTA